MSLFRLCMGGFIGSLFPSPYPRPCVSHAISKVGLKLGAKAGFGEQYLTQIHDTMPEVRLEHYDQSE
jgi:hypothetical protein